MNESGIKLIFHWILRKTAREIYMKKLKNLISKNINFLSEYATATMRFVFLRHVKWL